MKKTLINIISLGLIGWSLVGLVPFSSAQEEPTPSPSPTSETTNTLRERIERIVEQQKENVESILGEFPNQMRGFVGRVTRVSETTLTLENRGATRIVPITSDVILMRSGSEITADTVEIDNWAVVLGLMEGDSFSPKKITFTSTSLLPNPPVVKLGFIKNLKARALDLQARGQEEIVTATLTSTTEYQTSAGQAIELADFAVDDQVLLIGYQTDDKNIATIVRALAPIE